MFFEYWKWDKAISKEQCELIIKSVNWDEESKAEVIKGVDENIRKTKLVWNDSLSVVGCIADRYIRTANNLAGWDFDISFTEKIQMGKYEVGGFYDWHTDFIMKDFNDPRKISFTLQLNDPNEYEGGNLEFKGFNEQPVLQQGTIIVFLSTLNHRVAPVTKGTRYSAVTWMHGPKFK